MRGFVALLTVAALVAGCANHRKATPAPRETPAAADTPEAAPASHRRRPVPRPPAVLVTVVDGDTNVRVVRARVTIGRRSARTDRHGVARIPVARRAPLITVASKAGYGTRAVRLSFRTRPKSTLRIYRRSLQWTMYGAGPGRTQVQDAIHVRPPFRVVWSRGLGSLVEFPAVVANGIAYIANSRGTVWALDMRAGRVVWKHETPHGKMAASPVIWRDELVVHGMDGHVWVLRRSDGRLLWQFGVASPVESSPVVTRGLDVFGAWNGTITALDLRTHRVRWRRRMGCKITSSASLAGSTVYIGDYCGRLLSLSARTGGLIWSARVNGRVYGTPAVAGARIFVPSSTGCSLTAFSRRGRLLWRRSVGSYVYSSPAVWRGRVFFGAYNGVFYALSAATGRTLWTVGARGPISGAAVVVDGVAYAGSFAHRIVGVDALSGRTLVVFPHGEYVPVSGSGRKLLLHGFSRIYAVVHR